MLEGSQSCWRKDDSDVLVLGECGEQFGFKAIRMSGNP